MDIREANNIAEWVLNDPHTAGDYSRSESRDRIIQAFSVAKVSPPAWLETPIANHNVDDGYIRRMVKTFGYAAAARRDEMIADVFVPKGFKILRHLFFCEGTDTAFLVDLDNGQKIVVVGDFKDIDNSLKDCGLKMMGCRGLYGKQAVDLSEFVNAHIEEFQNFQHKRAGLTKPKGETK